LTNFFHVYKTWKNKKNSFQENKSRKQTRYKTKLCHDCIDSPTSRFRGAYLLWRIGPTRHMGPNLGCMLSNYGPLRQSKSKLRHMVAASILIRARVLIGSVSVYKTPSPSKLIINSKFCWYYNNNWFLNILNLNSKLIIIFRAHLL